MLKKSCKGSKCLAYEEKLIDEIDPHQDNSRPGKFNRAIERAKNLSDADWVKLSKELKKFKNDVASLKEEISVPTAMQVKIEENLESDLLVIENNIKRALDLSTLQTRYEFEILWLNYYNFLKINVMNVGESNPKDEDLTAPDMVKKLVQILILNRDTDRHVIEKIKTILLEWEE